MACKQVFPYSSITRGLAPHLSKCKTLLAFKLKFVQANLIGVKPWRPGLSTPAPAEMSRFVFSKMFSSTSENTARCKGVNPCSSETSTESFLFINSSRRALNTSVVPQRAASCKGVRPFTFFAAGSAPSASKRATML